MSYTWLPPLLNEIADVIGVEATLVLCKKRGGARLSIPAKAKDDHWLVDAIGREATDKLCEHFRSGYGGTTIDLPVGPYSAAHDTRRRVDDMIRAGLSINEIAHTTRVHRTTVIRRKANLDPTTIRKASGNQPDLFD